MIDYRPFRNTDSPALCEIWRNHPPLRAFSQPLTPSVLETTVLSKPFFDREGLIIATEAGDPIGFAHAGFACNPDGNGLDMSIGGTCMLMVSNPLKRPQVAGELLARSEQYLQQRGAIRLFGGGSLTLAPFYLGLYGGATVAGVLETDVAQRNLFTAAGYLESKRMSIMQRPLAGFRPIVDRHQIQLKRSMLVEALPDPCSTTWWEACTTGLTDRYCYIAKSRVDKATKATVVFWDIEPLASSWGVHARGLSQLKVQASQEPEAMTLFLLGESLRMMAAEGATLAEAHIGAVDDPLHPILSKLGFYQVEQAVEYCKAVNG